MNEKNLLILVLKFKYTIVVEPHAINALCFPKESLIFFNLILELTNLELGNCAS